MHIYADSCVQFLYTMTSWHIQGTRTERTLRSSTPGRL